MELWAGNERAHRSLELAGLESDVIAVPSGGDTGGDLSAVFSCSDNTARIVLADCVGHGYTAAAVARHVHHLLHKFQDIRDTAGLLGALNDAFTLSNEDSPGPASWHCNQFCNEQTRSRKCVVDGPGTHGIPNKLGDRRCHRR